MLLPNPDVDIWLYRQPVDMRKQFDGLAALAQTKLNQRVTDGALFVFINRRRTQMKVLYYSQGGLCLWGKRLEQGTFHQVIGGSEKLSLDWVQLQCLIAGINWQKSIKNKRL